MEFCHYLAERVSASAEPWRPVLLRERKNEPVALMERGRRSDEKKCSLVVCVHVNSMDTQPTWHGLTTYHLSGSWIGRELGNTMMRAAPKPLHKAGWTSISTDEGAGKWIQRPRNVLRVHQCAAVLVEVGYCSNQGDAKALAHPAVRAGLASMVELALARFRYLEES
jgi:N-acetylmuramoyl-L-alanine amidase